MTIAFGLLVLGSYLLGSVPAAYLAARLSRGIDLRQYGSGALGMSNLFQITSIGLAAPVTIFDVGKGMAMIWVAQLVGLGIAQQVTVGFAAIIGHNWPVFLRFSGGRGLLTTMGTAFYLMPWGMLVFAVIASPTVRLRSSPLPVLAAIAALPIAAWGMGKPMAVILGLLAMFLLMVFRRLTAPRSAMAASVSSGELLINRLLFDRDIRDGKVWMNRKPTEINAKKQPITLPKKQGEGS